MDSREVRRPAGEGKEISAGGNENPGAFFGIIMILAGNLVASSIRKPDFS
jgi:hypothetical protein